jgi:2-C-methyl-D-erythritol 4-phosphate cytidylyltransferase
MRTAAVIVSAGLGRRFGAAKHEALLSGRPILEWSLEAFHSIPEIDGVVLVLRDTAGGEALRPRFPKIISVARGGAERQDSVRSGFRELDSGGWDVVLIHDGVRPLVDKPLIRRVIEAAAASGAAVPVIPQEDTLKEVEGGIVRATLDRTQVFRSQTPQGFQYALLRQALEEAEKIEYSGTDEAVLLERMGLEVAAVPGARSNIKITTPEDLKIAEAFLDAL